MTVIDRMKIHEKAWDAPREHEVALKALMTGLRHYCELGGDLPEAIGPLATHLIELIENGPTGRLDRGTLRYDVERLARKHGVKL